VKKSYLIVFCTCPDQVVAERIAGVLVEERHAACVNLVPGVTSIYRWDDQQQSDQELLLMIKTRFDRFGALKQRIGELHPYEVPEIIALPIIDGATNYLRWIDSSVR
jgi:periplasmic divalent cation tolerance protein